MPTFKFKPRYAIPSVTDPDFAWLREVILRPCALGREFGEATIEFTSGSHATSMVLINDRELGYYLNIGPGEWLSLGDRRRLSEVICPDDWKVSAGLFISPDRAWTAIEHFCKSGLRSEGIDWIRPSEMPEDGNW